ncbi:low temperature requirement protein A [Caulobacter sp. S45]|uniref:low temperature requirement protein A n=1 Tax=Caulobacter sp. S45 TaxID=1641861 RepID=UPI0020B1583C|nr:low temperature requirement protein A [Caulobacter sp. S45]
MHLFARTNLLRRRDETVAARVTQIELFFDLVFVFAVTQLSHTLLAHFTPMGVLQTTMLFAGVWWVWMYTSWVTNWLDPERRSVRLLLLAMMLAAMVLSTALPHAFERRGLAFAGAYVAMQVGRSLFMLWALHDYSPRNYRNFQRITVWLATTGVLWLWGGFSEGSMRLGLWLLALGIDLVSPAAGFWTPGWGRSTTQDWDIDGGHLAERCSAFVLIALGESVTVTGAAFFELHWTDATVAAFLSAFLLATAMWWIYFDTAAERTSRLFAAHKDPGRIARVAYTYVHAALVGGIIVAAVADERVLDHPWARADLGTAAVVLGGPALYLLGNGLFRRLLSPRFAPSHLIGLALLVALAAISLVTPLLVLSGAATGVTILVAIAGSLLHRRQAAAAGEDEAD